MVFGQHKDGSWPGRLLGFGGADLMGEEDHYAEGEEYHYDDDGTYGVGPVIGWDDDEGDD